MKTLLLIGLLLTSSNAGELTDNPKIEKQIETMEVYKDNQLQVDKLDKDVLELLSDLVL